MRDTRASTRRPVFVSPDNDGTDATSHLAVGELRFLLPSKYDLSDVGGLRPSRAALSWPVGDQPVRDAQNWASVLSPLFVPTPEKEARFRTERSLI